MASTAAKITFFLTLCIPSQGVRRQHDFTRAVVSRNGFSNTRLEVNGGASLKHKHGVKQVVTDRDNYPWTTITVKWIMWNTGFLGKYPLDTWTWTLDEMTMGEVLTHVFQHLNKGRDFERTSLRRIDPSYCIVESLKTAALCRENSAAAFKLNTEMPQKPPKSEKGTKQWKKWKKAKRARRNARNKITDCIDDAHVNGKWVVDDYEDSTPVADVLKALSQEAGSELNENNAVLICHTE